MKNSIYPNIRRQNNSTITSYQNKKLYQESAFPKPYFEYYFDSTEDRGMYGLVDIDGEVVIPVTPANSQFYVYSSNNIPVMDFVHTAFQDMKNYIQQNVYTNRFDFNSDINLLDLTIRKSYIDVTDSYINYLSKYFDALNTFLTDERLKQINTFDDFLRFFLSFTHSTSKHYPITRTAYITSEYCNHNISGLIVEILQNGNKNVDEIKYNNFIANPNFANIIDAAQRYGFMIDKNAPWRFIFDINSSAGVSYLRNVGINTPKELFQKRYYRSTNSDIDSVKNMLIASYNALVQRKPTDEKVFFNNYCNKFSSEKISKQYVTLESLNERYNENYWIRFYSFLRAKETNTQLTQEQFELIVLTTQKLNAYSSHEKAMKYLSSIFVIPQKKQPSMQDLTTNNIAAIMTPQTEELIVNNFKF